MASLITSHNEHWQHFCSGMFKRQIIQLHLHLGVKLTDLTQEVMRGKAVCKKLGVLQEPLHCQ